SSRRYDRPDGHIKPPERTQIWIKLGGQGQRYSPTTQKRWRPEKLNRIKKARESSRALVTKSNANDNRHNCCSVQMNLRAPDQKKPTI
ncbi:hypothetical protein ACQR1E_20650, partial [Bradyrhizobium sp. HKCCYLRH1030]